MVKKISAFLGVLALTFTMAGCNTTQGVGKDIERGGEKLQGVAKDTQKKM